MKINLPLIVAFFGMTILCYGQEAKIDAKEIQYCDSIKELIIANEHKVLLSNFISLEEIDKEKLSEVVSNYSTSIKNGKFRFNDYQVSMRVGSDMKVTSYGYRWATVENHTMYTIEIATSYQQDKYLIKELEFVSYDNRLQSINFPKGAVNKDDLPPSIPPPPPGKN